MILLSMSLLLVGCLNAECPCGSDPNDPLSEHDLSFPGLHVVNDECVCQCGEDEPVAFPRDRDCFEHERSCIAESGEPAEMLCQ